MFAMRKVIPDKKKHLIKMSNIGAIEQTQNCAKLKNNCQIISTYL